MASARTSAASSNSIWASYQDVTQESGPRCLGAVSKPSKTEEAAMALSIGNDRGRIADINVTPMADVMIVLLIIFMVTVPLLRDGPIANLPEAAHSRVQAEGPPVVSVAAHGALFIDGLPMLSLDDLAAAVQSSLANRADKTIHVRAESGLGYSEVGRVLEACRRAGAQSVALVAQPRLRSGR